MKAAWVGIALLAPAPVLQLYFAGNWYSFFHSYSLGMAFGIVSYVYFLNTLILSCRIRYFDRLFGHDRVLRFHGYLALAAFVCAGFHYYFKQMYFPDPTLQSLLGVIGLAGFAVVILVALLLMVKNRLHRISLVDKMREVITRKPFADYSILKGFHNLSVAASLVIAVHVLLSSATGESVVRQVVMGGWAGVALLMWIYHKVGRVLRRLRGRLSITAVNRLSDRIVELRARATTKKIPVHRAGQFGYFRIQSEACGFEEHPYTISSAPDTGELSITAANLGDYSERLFSVAPGDCLLYDGPYGTFTPVNDGRSHLFIAGGIGITPFTSIVADWDRAGIAGPLHLVWSVRTEDALVYRAMFQEIESRNPLFRFDPVVTREPASQSGIRRIDQALLGTHIGRGTENDTMVYYCGPESLRRVVLDALKLIGIPRKNIHFERFSF